MCFVNVRKCLCLGNCLERSYPEGQSGLFPCPSPSRLLSLSVCFPKLSSEAAARVVFIKFPMTPCWLLNTVQSFKQVFRALMICTYPLPLLTASLSIASISACCYRLLWSPAWSPAMQRVHAFSPLLAPERPLLPSLIKIYATFKAQLIYSASPKSSLIALSELIASSSALTQPTSFFCLAHVSMLLHPNKICLHFGFCHPLGCFKIKVMGSW